VKNPSNTPVFADSVNKGNFANGIVQQFYVIRDDWNGVVHLRHNNFANVAFADASVRGQAGNDLMIYRNIGYYVDGNFFSYYI
jgi:prepilin-type processing-associated H-X9-DG protein